MASTVIGAGITIEGEVTSDEDVVVAGTLRGKLNTKEAVTVESGGSIEADVHGHGADRNGVPTLFVRLRHHRILQPHVGQLVLQQ